MKNTWYSKNAVLKLLMDVIMRTYVGPDWHVLSLDIGGVICGSVVFDAIDYTERFDIDIDETI